MIENYGQNTPLNTNATEQQPRKILKMVKNERMGGYVPSWEVPKTAKDSITSGLANAERSQSSGFENALALHDGQIRNYGPDDEFGFGDLVDMVNPLHHIPVVGSIYREVTGDQIKPIGKIIGGGIFGGGVGAASGLVNVIVEEETGKDLTGNAVSFALEGKRPTYKNHNYDSPEKRLNDAVNNADSRDELPASMLSFTDQSYKTGRNLNIRNIDDADDIIAGLPQREAISDVNIPQRVPFKEL